MKKFASILMAAAMLLCIAGCSLFSKADMVKLGDYEHTDPDGISYDTRTVLKNDGFIEAEGTPAELESSNEYYKLFSKTL